MDSRERRLIIEVEAARARLPAQLFVDRSFRDVALRQIAAGARQVQAALTGAGSYVASRRQGLRLALGQGRGLGLGPGPGQGLGLGQRLRRERGPICGRQPGRGYERGVAHERRVAHGHRAGYEHGVEQEYGVGQGHGQGRGQGQAELGSGRRSRPGQPCWDLTSLAADPSSLSRVQAQWAAWQQRFRDAGQATLIVPAGLVGLAQGIVMPDLDISLVGIGAHRFFLFHSGLVVWGLEQLYLRYYRQMELDAPSSPPMAGRPMAAYRNHARRVLMKVAGGLLGAAAIGVGIHLVIDVFQPKAVIFPVIGSLLDGTLVDDNIWLLGNALWCFRIAHDVFALVLADDLDRALAWARRHLVSALFPGCRASPSGR